MECSRIAYEYVTDSYFLCSDLQHIRVVRRVPEVCEDNGLVLSEALADQLCVEYVDIEDKTTTCIVSYSRN